MRCYCASVTFSAPAPSTCAHCHSLRHHCHHPQLQPFTGSFAEPEGISRSPYDLSTARTRSVVPALEATLGWERFTPPDEVSALGHPLFPAVPTANTAEPLLDPRALSGNPSGSPLCPALPSPGHPAPAYPLNAWSLLFPSASLVPPHETGSTALLC